MENKKQIGSAIWRLNETLNAVYEELMENGGEITEEIEDTLTKSELIQVEIVDGLQTLISKVKAEDEVIASEIKRLQALKKSRANGVEGLKRFLLNYMLNNNVSVIEGELCKVSVASGRESVNVDEAKLLAAFSHNWDDALLPPYITVEAKVNKTELLKYLKEDRAVVPTIKEGNVDVPLANIVRNPYLIIK